jgi:hypothetical protein
LICRSIESFTASALNGVPSWKLIALAQLEGVAQPVLRDRPGLGEAGHDLRALVREHDQRLDDAAPDAVGVEIGHLRGVEVHRLGHEADDERPAGCAQAETAGAARPIIATTSAATPRQSSSSASTVQRFVRRSSRQIIRRTRRATRGLC